jgi:hypothetical protein
VNAALAGESLNNSVFWRACFAEQKPLWAVSYSRAPWPANRRPTIDGFDEDHSSSARKTGAPPVLA